MAFSMGNVAEGAAGAVIGQGMNLLFGGMQDKRQAKQAKRLQDIQMEGQRAMTDYQNKAALQMWKDTNYSAQVEEAKKAGLSMGIFSKGGGSSGATASSAAGQVSGASPGDPNAGVANGMALAQQLALTRAQTQNIEADTELKKQDAGLKGGAQTDNLNADTALKGTQKQATSQSIAESKAKIDEIGARIRNIENQTDIGVKTKYSQIKIAEEEAVTGVLRNILMAEQKDNIRSGTAKNRSEVEVNNAKINQMGQQILQGWDSLRQGDENIAISKFKEEVKANYPNITDVMGRNFDDLIYSIWSAMGKDRPQKKGLQQ